MSNIHTSAAELIGKTPLLELTHLEKELDLEAMEQVSGGKKKRPSKGALRYDEAVASRYSARAFLATSARAAKPSASS